LKAFQINKPLNQHNITTKWNRNLNSKCHIISKKYLRNIISNWNWGRLKLCVFMSLWFFGVFIFYDKVMNMKRKITKKFREKEKLKEKILWILCFMESKDEVQCGMWFFLVLTFFLNFEFWFLWFFYFFIFLIIEMTRGIKKFKTLKKRQPSMPRILFNMVTCHEGLKWKNLKIARENLQKIFYWR